MPQVWERFNKDQNNTTQDKILKKQRTQPRKTGKTTKTLKVRKYRKDKTYPKNTKVIVIEDLGRFEQVTTLTSQFKTEKNVQPKQHNPNLIWIYKGETMKIGYYLDSGRCFVWGKNCEYLGTLHKYDLKRLFSKIGATLRQHGSEIN